MRHMNREMWFAELHSWSISVAFCKNYQALNYFIRHVAEKNYSTVYTSPSENEKAKSSLSQEPY